MQGEVIINRYNCGLKHFYPRGHNLQIWNVDIFDDGCTGITFFLRTKLVPFNWLWIFIACLQNSKATWPMGSRVSTRASTRTRQVSVCLSLLRSFSQPMPGKPSLASTNLPSSQPSGIATTSTFLYASPWHGLSDSWHSSARREFAAIHKRVSLAIGNDFLQKSWVSCKTCDF